MTIAATISETSRGCYLVDRDATSPGWSQEFLLRSDAHHDNAHTNQRLEAIHLEEALDRKAGILDIGDLHCAMQGKWDKRASTDGCRPEQREGRYLDSLVECAAEFYEPYAANWLLMSPGNHEGSILKRHETDLTERTAERLVRTDLAAQRSLAEQLAASERRDVVQLDGEDQEQHVADGVF